MKKFLVFITLLSFSLPTYAFTELETTLYKSWSLQNYSLGDLFFDYNKQDCLGLTNSFTGSGDLLSSLIVDDQFRKKIVLKQYDKDYKAQLADKNMLTIYTPEYIFRLDTVIHKKLKANFYTRYVCHIDAHTDIIAGGYTPDIRNSNTLILRRNNSVFILSKKVQIYDNTATGGDVAHCRTNLSNKDSLTWKCFAGILRDKTGVVGNKGKEYTISLRTGKVLKIRLLEEKP